jgi:hypothetical protein
MNMELITFTIEEDSTRVAQRFSTALRPLGYGVINSTEDDSYYGEVYGGVMHHLVAIIRIAPGKTASGTIMPISQEDSLDWPSVLRDIEVSAYRPPAELTPDQVIEKYYRRRARNKKLTLRQHLRDLGLEHRENNIRVAKVRYDARRKRG